MGKKTSLAQREQRLKVELLELEKRLREEQIPLQRRIAFGTYVAALIGSIGTITGAVIANSKAPEPAPPPTYESRPREQSAPRPTRRDDFSNVTPYTQPDPVRMHIAAVLGMGSQAILDGKDVAETQDDMLRSLDAFRAGLASEADRQTIDDVIRSLQRSMPAVHDAAPPRPAPRTFDPRARGST
jgi:hypothetical protein